MGRPPGQIHVLFSKDTHPPLTVAFSTTFLLRLRYRKASLLGVRGLCTSWLYRFSSNDSDLLSDRGDIPFIQEPGVPGVSGVIGARPKVPYNRKQVWILPSWHTVTGKQWQVSGHVYRIEGIHWNCPTPWLHSIPHCIPHHTAYCIPHCIPHCIGAVKVDESL